MSLTTASAPRTNDAGLNAHPDSEGWPATAPDASRRLVSIGDGVIHSSLPKTLSPIQLLPSELLCQIFVYASVNDIVRLFPDRTYRQPTSHGIIQVCRYWRRVALNNPEMWNHEIILDRPPGPLSSFLPLSFALPVESFIRRLEGILRLYGRNFSRARLDYEHSLEPLIDIILQRQDQLVALSLTGRRIYDKIQHFRMPHLEALLLCRRSISNATILIDFDAPKLRKVFICDQGWTPASATYPNLPWAQLTHLSFGVPYGWKTTRQGGYATLAPPFWQLLAVVPNLTYLHLTEFKPVADQTDQEFLAELSQPAPVLATLPRLKVLEIHDKDLRSLTRKPSIPKSSVLRFISTPRLENFDLVFSTQLSQEDFRDLLQPFLQRNPLLRRMRLVLCSSETFIGCHRPTSLRPILLKFVGDASFFANLVNQVSMEGESGKDFIQHGRRVVAPRKEVLEDDIWLDRLIDRYFDEEEHDTGRLRQVVEYGLDERMLIKSMFDILGDFMTIERAIERHLLLAV
jgi:hypothetical protein